MRLGSADHLAVALALGAAILLLGLGADAKPLSNKDYCADDGTNVMFVIDVTTEYDPKDKELLVRAVGDIFDSLAGGERIVIRSITSSFSTSDRLIDRCIPTCLAKGLLDRWLNCSDGLIVSDSRRVKQEIVQSLRRRLENFTELARSDIIRTIAQVSREEAKRDRRQILYVLSDLIENSEKITARIFFETDNDRLMRYLRKYDLIASLEGVEVRAFGVGRGSTQDRLPLAVNQHKKLLDFWHLYFREAKAGSVEISQNMIEHR
jgi:hypothetical protein